MLKPEEVNDFRMNRYMEPKWQSSALLTIDMQEDFARREGAAYIEGTRNIIPKVQQLVQFYRSKEWPIIHVVRLYKKDGSNVDLCRRKSVEEGNPIVSPGSDGAELINELKPDDSVELDADILLNMKAQKLNDGERVLYKPRWGAFYHTRLNKLLNQMNISTVVIAGCNYPNCPRTTVYEASERDYRVVLVNDAVSGLYPRGEEELRNIGVSLMTTDALLLNR